MNYTITIQRKFANDGECAYRYRRRCCDLVGLGDLLELGLGLLLAVGVLVRVPLHGQLPVRLLQLLLGGAPLHLQQLVVVHPHNESPLLSSPLL
ncbi:Os02g0306801, partial [Oryza sativa Japonica Group]